MDEHTFFTELEKKGIILSNEMLNQFKTYYELLVRWNEKMNLTAITGKDDVYLKHFYDSLTLSFNLKLESQSLLDVGAGAGFPSIPLKIAYPNLKIYILDSQNKRMTFIQEVIKVLKLDNVLIIVNRAEDEARNRREEFDIVTARAVARLNILTELCLPFVKVNGYFVPLKGIDGLNELNDAKNAIETLGGKLDSVQELDLPIVNDKRYNFYIKKIKKTSTLYPRHYSKIKKNPL